MLSISSQAPDPAGPAISNTSARKSRGFHGAAPSALRRSEAKGILIFQHAAEAANGEANGSPGRTP